jgi:hypothetical protein
MFLRRPLATLIAMLAVAGCEQLSGLDGLEVPSASTSCGAICACTTGDSTCVTSCEQFEDECAARGQTDAFEAYLECEVAHCGSVGACEAESTALSVCTTSVLDASISDVARPDAVDTGVDLGVDLGVDVGADTSAIGWSACVDVPFEGGAFTTLDCSTVCGSQSCSATCSALGFPNQGIIYWTDIADCENFASDSLEPMPFCSGQLGTNGSDVYARCCCE